MEQVQRFSIDVAEELAEWLRRDAKRNHRNLRGEFAALLEKAREVMETREAPEPAA